MCTVTILYRETGLVVTMNRDEHIDRPAERAPHCWKDGILTAPMDGLASGTWVGMNSGGWWACLLNGYEDYKRPPFSLSRGLLIPDILNQPDPAHRVGAIDMQLFAPFRLLLGTHDAVFHYHWDGRNFEQKPVPHRQDYLVTSSSWEAEKVLPLRQEAFRQWQKAGAMLDPEKRPAIHLWRGDDPRSGILMTRPYAHTTSMTQITVDGRKSRMDYWPRHRLMDYAA